LSWFGFQLSRLLRVCLGGSGGSVNHLYSLINIQQVDPIALANSASIHPNAMKYIRKVMPVPPPELPPLLLLAAHP